MPLTHFIDVDADDEGNLYAYEYETDDKGELHAFEHEPMTTEEREYFEDSYSGGKKRDADSLYYEATLDLKTVEGKRKFDELRRARQYRELIQGLQNRLDVVDRRIRESAVRLRAALAAVRESKAEVEKSRAELIAALTQQSPSPQ